MKQWHSKGGLALTVLIACCGSRALAADPVPPEARLVSAAGAPSATVKEFDIAAAQDLVVTLTDLQQVAPLDSASVVVSQGGAIVDTATYAKPATSANMELPAASGHYVMRVFGTPSAAFGIGFFSVCVAPKSAPSACIQSASVSGNVASPTTGGDPTVSAIAIDFVVNASGAYTVTLADHQFPSMLNVAPTAALFQGSTQIAVGIQSGTSLTLSPGNYRFLAIAQADQTARAGLFGVNITGPSGTVLDDSYAVGSLAPFAAPNNPAQQSLTLKVTDFAFPSALASASVAVTMGAAKLATASSAGAAVDFTAPASTSLSSLKVWTSAAGAAGPGTYAAELKSASSTLFSSAYGFGDASGKAYAYTTDPLAAGAYKAIATDFEFPSTLQSLKFAVVQGGAILQQAAAAGTLDFTASAGPVTILVAARTPVSGNGLFAATVQTSEATPQIVFDRTQGVSDSALFDTRVVTLGTGGGLDVGLSDLNFPGPFQDLALVASRGGVVLGKIFGAGTFPVAGSPGTVQLTFIATPSSAQQYGMYSLKMVASAPTVTLSASPSTLVAGESTTLSWTTADAESCTGSGGSWSGNKALSNSTEVVKVDATATFTLTCTGPGGTSAKSVTVNATAKPASSGGGGGAFDAGALLLLAALWLLAQTARRELRAKAR